jgi:DNA-binding XRE family transcriptional regulator
MVIQSVLSKAKLPNLCLTSKENFRIISVMKTQLQKIREGKPLTRAELAKLSGITERTIYSIEEGRSGKIQDRIRRGLVNALHVSHSALFNKTGLPKTS